MEVFFGWYSANKYESYMTWNRMFGPYAWTYWSLIFCNGIAPQILWFKKMRTNIPALFIISVIVSIGMWLERFVIIVVQLDRDFLPSSWGNYTPTVWEVMLYVGTFGLFFTLFLLFVALPAGDFDCRNERTNPSRGAARRALKRLTNYLC